MKPTINIIEVKDGVYVVSVQAHTPGVAVYWKHADGTTCLMRPTKKMVDKSKVSGKVLSITDHKARRAAFVVHDGGLNETRRNISDYRKPRLVRDL